MARTKSTTRTQSPPPLAPPVRGAAQHLVNCPGCGDATRYASTNPYRPFCSARCQGQDFGAWASEHYRMGPSADPHGDPHGDASDE